MQLWKIGALGLLLIVVLLCMQDSNISMQLIDACQKGDSDEAILLVSQNSDIDIRDNERLTPLMYACWNGLTEVVKLLTERGADVNAKDCYGKTPLMYACWSGFIDVTNLLIEQGADISAKDSQGKTALMYACLENRLDVAKLLISRGADVNVKDKNGQKLLILACKSKQIQAVELLIEKGAEITAAEQAYLTSIKLQHLDLTLWQQYVNESNNFVPESVATLANSKIPEHVDTVAAIHAYRGDAVKAWQFVPNAMLETPVRIKLLLAGMRPPQVESLLNIESISRYLLLIIHYKREKNDKALAKIRDLVDKQGEAKNSTWLSHMLDFYNGQVGETDLLDMANRETQLKPVRLCQFYYYVGMYYMLQENLAVAQDYLQKCIAQNQDECLETFLAKQELANRRQ